ncbi:GMC oxidoreductase family protein [Abortiporus biennis]
MTNNTGGFAATTFDYIVVGGGTAGLTVATRLSEDPNATVGIIEAGKLVTDSPIIDIPGYIGRTLANPELDWMFSSVPQESLDGRRSYLPRGKVVGGSSVLNFMTTTRANKDEYNAFETLGNPGWNWPQFLSYLKKSELALKLDHKFHSDHGPIQKSYTPFIPALHKPFLDSFNALGVEINLDPQNGDNAGVFTMTVSVDPDTMTRSSATTGYYLPNSGRPNLHLLSDAQVTRIITDTRGDTIRATGVEYKQGGELFTAQCTREVIVAAGSYQTPQLLELSGIGNPKVLNKFGIPVVVDLPGVGENLRTCPSNLTEDHPCVPIIREVNSDTQTRDILQDPAVSAEQLRLYEQEKKGMFSSTHMGIAMVPLPSMVPKTEILALQTKVRHQSAGAPAKPLELQHDWLENPSLPQVEYIHATCWFPIGEPGVLQSKPACRYDSLLAILLRPFSRGSVHITSSDQTQPPAIDHNYLSNPADLDILFHAVKFAQKAMTTSPLGQYHLAFEHPNPACTDEEIHEWVRKYVISAWHPTGTASMLPRDEGGVADSNLLVYGTNNLRIVDASIQPFPMSCHSQTTVYAMAEKAADLIKLAYQCSS